MRDLLPAGGRAGRLIEDDPQEHELAELYAYPDPPPGRTFHLRANFVSTLDGSAAGHDGRSGSINNAADLRVFSLLRSLCDVILAGAGTVRTEAYRAARPRPAFAARRRAAGQQPAPSLAVVTRSGDVPTGSGLFGGPSPTILITCEGAGDDALRRMRSMAGDEHVVATAGRDVDLRAGLEALAARGLVRMLCEGGPTLMRGLVDAGLVDELCLTWTPCLVGGPAPRILHGDPVSASLMPGHLLEHDGTLLGRWVVTR